MSGHSVLSPSGSDTWSVCLGKLAAAKELPKSPDNAASLLGSAKHAISELVLSNPTGQTIDAMVGQIWYLSANGKELSGNHSEGCYKFEIDDTFADHCKVYIDYVNSRPGKKEFEVFANASDVYGVPDQGGTIDCKHLDYDIREIEIIDAKFGFIPVGAKHKQLRIYLASVLTVHDFEADWDTFRCTIVQPQDIATPIKTHVYTRAEIEAFVAEIRPAAQVAYGLWLNPPANLLDFLTPGPVQCNWCEVAERGCVKRNAHIANMFEDVTTKTPDVVLMTDAQLGELYPKLPDVAEWVAQISAEAQRRAFAGLKLPGNKLIYGRKGNREYVEGSEDSVKGVLEMALGPDDMYQPRKLVTPTAAEQALKKAQAGNLYAMLKPFVTQTDPRLKLVPESVKGDAVTVAAFDVVTP